MLSGYVCVCLSRASPHPSALDSVMPPRHSAQYDAELLAAGVHMPPPGTRSGLYICLCGVALLMLVPVMSPLMFVFSYGDEFSMITPLGAC